MWRTVYSFKVEFLTLGLLVLNFLSVSSSEEITSKLLMTPTERAALEKFKSIAKDIVTQDYQREDSFLRNWLLASNNDVNEAKRRLEKSMAWRKEKNIDSILDNPEMKRLQKRLKFSVDTVDKHGHPIVESDFRRWDLRRLTIAGKSEAVQLYFSYLFENGLKKARELSSSTGKNISEFILMFDLSGFNARKHACLACLGLLARVVTDVENNYTGFVEYYLAPNSPRGVDIIVDYLKPFMSSITKARLKVMSKGSPVAQKLFKELIDDDQLGRQYGGKRRTKQ